MSGIPKLQNHPSNLSPFSNRKGGFWLVLTFLIGFSGWSVVGQNLESIPPQYQWLNKEDIATVSLANLNTDDLIISIATDPQGNVYTLSFGQGVAKRDADGNMINPQFIPSGELDNPLDIAIDEVGFIYIADFLAQGEFFDNGKIRIFDSNGNFLPNRTILTSFYRPLGLDVNDENVYVAEFNDAKQGPEQNQQLSRVRIYNKSNGILVDETSQVEVPFRIAVDSQKNVFVSQAGNNSPAVLIFDQNLNYQGKLPNIISPGSVVVDSFDFIHVLEYTTRIDFSQFINFADIGLPEILAISNQIDRGISNEDFVIKIYDVNRTLVKTFKEFIDFPVDLAFNRCDRMYVNNAEIFGNPIFGIFIPSRLEFDLEIYKRSLSFDTEKPIISCPDNIEVKAKEGDNFAVVTFQNATATDANILSITQTAGLSSGSQFPVGDTNIEFTATDLCGNVSTCNFTITVIPSETTTDTEDPVITCPNPISKNNDLGECGAVVTFQLPTVTDNSGENITAVRTDIINLNSEDIFPVGITTLIFEATDAAGNSSSCDLVITVSDIQNPTISCPANIIETVAIGETGKKIDYNLPVFDDKCSESSINQTVGLASGSLFPLGATTNTFVVTDVAGNTSECSFTVTINQSGDNTSPIITCPNPISKNNDLGECGAVVTFQPPNVTDDSGEQITAVRIDNINLSSGDLFPVGTTTLKFKATDSAGNKAECSFTITVIDNEDPKITCPSDKTEDYDPAIGFYLPDYTDLGNTNDNCEFVNVTQFPAIGTLVTGNTQIILTATDVADNSSTCSFMVTLSENAVLEIDCPLDQIGQLNENCQFTIPDFSGLATVNFQNAIITQSPLAGTIVSAATIIKLTAALNGQMDDCSFQLILEDTIAPVARCATGYDIWLNANGTASLNATDINNNSSDNCGIVSMQIDKTTFTSADIGVIKVTLTVIDVAGTSDSCETSVRVHPYEGSASNFSCLTEFVLQLDESGKAVLNADHLYSGDAGDRTFTISKSVFDCSNIGANDVTLTYTGSDGSDSCKINVVVKDEIPPVVRLKNITMFLNQLGQVILSPALFNDGSTDNCGTLSFSLDRISFSCIDLGENAVTLTVKDAQGNIASGTAILNISGNCVEEPEEPSEETFEHIFIYPNPTSGPFTFDTPSGWSIDKVEVYDARGRYVLTETYSANQIEYSMDLSSLQQAVYILKLYTSQGIRIIRVIIY